MQRTASAHAKGIPVWKALAACFAAGAILVAAVQAEAGATLDRVRSKKVLRCGVSEGLTGFSLQDKSGRWTGMDADFCRAVAAAMGPSVKVEFVPLTASARFVALQMKKIDLLSRSTTWTLGREAHLGVQFVGVLYFDGQAFMVTRKSGINRAERLKGSTICVRKGTTTEMNLAEYSSEKALNLKALVVDTQDEADKALFAGRCKAYTSDYSILASERLAAPGGAGEYVILPERISKEPTGPAVRRGDEEWLRLVKWVLFALIEAEERGVTRENAATMKKTTQDPAVRRLLGAEGGFGKALGTDNDWALRAIQASGNYGEMFERNLGRNSALKLDRGVNRLETKGGLMWAPPFR
jgi:general L-amino acid transport system substrate-binding protein